LNSANGGAGTCGKLREFSGIVFILTRINVANYILI
jgi:hypothetical protein